MAVLSDREILEAIEAGRLKIEPFNEDNLTPNGYDLSIGSIRYEGEDFTDGTVTVRPGGWFLLSTGEVVGMDQSMIGNMWLRSSWVRKGLITCFGVIDAGFEGSLTLSGFNAGPDFVDVDIGNTYAQMVIMTMGSAADKEYAERSGSYQGQRGIKVPE